MNPVTAASTLPAPPATFPATSRKGVYFASSGAASSVSANAFVTSAALFATASWFRSDGSSEQVFMARQSPKPANAPWSAFRLPPNPSSLSFTSPAVASGLPGCAVLIVAHVERTSSSVAASVPSARIIAVSNDCVPFCASSGANVAITPHAASRDCWLPSKILLKSAPSPPSIAGCTSFSKKSFPAWVPASGFTIVLRMLACWSVGRRASAFLNSGSSSLAVVSAAIFSLSPFSWSMSSWSVDMPCASCRWPSAERTDVGCFPLRSRIPWRSARSTCLFRSASSTLFFERCRSTVSSERSLA